MPRGITNKYRSPFDERYYARRDDSICTRNVRNLTIALQRAMGNWDLDRKSPIERCLYCGKQTWQHKPANFCSAGCYFQFRRIHYKGIEQDIEEDEDGFGE